MKRLLLLLAIVTATIMTLYGFRPNANGMITGKVVPVGAAKAIWAISGTDSIKANLISGNFSISVKAGTYQVFAEAETPYKSTALEGIQVKDGSPTDVGAIILSQ